MPSAWTAPTPSTTSPSAARCGSWAASRRRSGPSARRPSCVPGTPRPATPGARPSFAWGAPPRPWPSSRPPSRAEPRLAEAHSNLGVALWGLGRRAEALRALRRAAHLAKDEPDPLRNLGLALLELGRPDRAVDVLRRAAALSPGQAPALLDLAEAAFEAGRHAEAQGALDQASGLDATAIASRPRSLAARDALRLERLRAEAGELPAPDARTCTGWPCAPSSAPRRPWGAFGPAAAWPRLSSSAPPSSSRSRRPGSWPRSSTTTSCATPSRSWPGRRSTTTPTCAIASRTPSTSAEWRRSSRRNAARSRRGLPGAASPASTRCRGRSSRAGRARSRFRIDVEQPYVAPAEGRR